MIVFVWILQMISEKDVCEIKKYVKEFNIQSIAFDLDGVLLETDHTEAEKQLSFSEKCIMAKHTISHAR